MDPNSSSFNTGIILQDRTDCLHLPLESINWDKFKLKTFKPIWCLRLLIKQGAGGSLTINNFSVSTAGSFRAADLGLVYNDARYLLGHVESKKKKIGLELI